MWWVKDNIQKSVKENQYKVLIIWSKIFLFSFTLIFVQPSEHEWLSTSSLLYAGQVAFDTNLFRK